MRNETHRRFAIWIVFALVLVTFALAKVAQAGNDNNGRDKITICHHTGSESNPSVTITIALPAYEAHVANHEDGEFDTEGECPVVETTTTTTIIVTTTTVPEVTTTTAQETPTTTEPVFTPTTLPFDQVGPTTTVTPTTVPLPGPEITVLPFTGWETGFLVGLAALFAITGATLLVRSNRKKVY